VSFGRIPCMIVCVALEIKFSEQFRNLASGSGSIYG
jgi:hypothetical protein